MTRTVGVYIYNEVEVLDFAGPYEVFSTASRVHLRINPLSALPFSVKLIAAEPGVIEARGGLRILPDHPIAGCPTLDILIMPGGVVEEELKREDLYAWIESIEQSTQIIASVCTGSFILAKAGLLEGLQATTHWEDLEGFVKMFPRVNVLEHARWVDEGRVVTSAGISAGIDMSLYLVSRLEGKELAERTARQMDYRWLENP